MKQRTYYSTYLLYVCFFATSIFGLQAQDYQLNIGCFEKMELTNEKNVNSKALESFPTWIKDTLFLLKGVDGGKDYQIVRAEKSDNNGWSGSVALPEEINSPNFEGPFSYDAKNDMLYFTRSDFNKKKILKESKRNKDSILVHLTIWEISMKPGSKAHKINLNNDSYSISDPAISPDGEWMVFTSDQPWGWGKRDLYIARRDGNNWEGTVNLGKEINSPFNEGFATFLNDKVLVFASDREGGSGGFDLYYCVVKNGIWDAPKLFPKPVNSPMDDVSFILGGNDREGYLATNRPGGKGEDDIYRWASPQSIFRTVQEEKEEEVEVDIFVFEKLTLLPFPEADVLLTPMELTRENIQLDDPDLDIVNLDTTGSLFLKWNTTLKDSETIVLKTDDRGTARTTLQSRLYYKVESTCEICDTEIMFYKPGQHGKQLNIALQPIGEEEEEADDEVKNIQSMGSKESAGSIFVLENIYYEYNSDVIQKGAANDLDILAEKMIENTTIKVLLESHTDSRGTTEYNKNLSERRAFQAKKYLLQKGIREERVLTRGLGESRLRNQCLDGIPCTEEEHRYNRRTEVIILPE